MRDGWLKSFLQGTAVATQFPPFTWLYRGLYALAVHACVARLRRIDGVRAIYLRRGLAAGGSVYGLADIDLFILADGGRDGPVGARARRQYERLRRFIPMLSPVTEFGIYSPESFRRRYRHSRFYRYRVGLTRHDWKRLVGQDIFRYLPAATDDPLWLATEDLGAVWYFLGHELLPDDRRPGHLRRYVAYKWLAETARAALTVTGGPRHLPRDETLAAGAEAFPEVAAVLHEVRRWRRCLARSTPVGLDPLIDAYVFLVRKALAGRPPGPQHRRRLRIPRAPDDMQRRLLGKPALEEIRPACDALGGVERAVFLPRLSFAAAAMLGLDPFKLHGATADEFDLVLLGRQRPAAERIRSFNRATARFQPDIRCFFCDGQLAMSLWPWWGWGFKTEATSPEFFAMLSSARPLAAGFELADAVELDRPFDEPDWLDSRARILLPLFGRPYVDGLSTRDFFLLFWEAARAAGLATRRGGGCVDVPVASEQIVEVLARLTPDAEPALRRTQQEYWKALCGRPSEAAQCAGWARQYAVRLLELLPPRAGADA